MGYKQPRSLTREFKRHSGLSPRQYQKSQHVR
jgi:AraC-like DNA-binding protein